MHEGLKKFRCTLDGITFDCEAGRVQGREIRDYRVHMHAVENPTVQYGFDLVMVSTPPVYTLNSIRINTLPLLGGLEANANTRFIWLDRPYTRMAAEYAFELAVRHVVKHIKEQRARNAKSE